MQAADAALGCNGRFASVVESTTVPYLYRLDQVSNVTVYIQLLGNKSTVLRPSHPARNKHSYLRKPCVQSACLVCLHTSYSLVMSLRCRSLPPVFVCCAATAAAGNRQQGSRQQRRQQARGGSGSSSSSSKAAAATTGQRKRRKLEDAELGILARYMGLTTVSLWLLDATLLGQGEVVSGHWLRRCGHTGHTCQVRGRPWQWRKAPPFQGIAALCQAAA